MNTTRNTAGSQAGRNEDLAAAKQLLPPPLTTAVNEEVAEAAAIEPVTEASVNEPVAEAAVNEPAADAVIAPAAISNLSNDINLNISAMIESNKPAKIGEIKTNEHSLKFSPEIDLVNPTAALDRLSAGIKKIINANAGDPLILDEAYAPPAPKSTYGERAKKAFKGVRGLFNTTKKVAPAPAIIDNSVINPIPGGRRVHTKKNLKRRITRSNRKRVRPSRRK